MIIFDLAIYSHTSQ